MLDPSSSLSGTAPEWAGSGTIIRVASGTVTHCGRPIELTWRERTVAVAIAVQPRPLRTEQLARLLFPDRDDEDAAKMVKVYVYRARRRVAPDFIVRTAPGYAVGPNVTVDLHAARLAHERLTRHDESLNADERDAILDLARGLRCAAIEHGPESEWWDAVAQRAARLGRDLAIAVGQNALKRGDSRIACAIALELTYEDGSDESAWELLIRAKLLEGDHREAARNFRSYEKALASDLGAAPSPYLRELVGR